MESSTLVWILNENPDDEQVWFPGVVQTKTDLENGDLQLEIDVQDVNEDGAITVRSQVQVVLEAALGHESETCKRRNDEADGQGLVQDLINLPHLHEPAILRAIYTRFEEGLIYTYTGPILIAVNPFKRLELYTQQVLETYYNQGIMLSQGIEMEPLDPHVYAISDNAYQDMMVRIRNKFAGDSALKGPESQSILISGESGAGKTVSTKVCLEYLTTVGKPQTFGEEADAEAAASSGQLTMDRVLQSNPILEAFGNARTIRNDNSSRFGKLMEMCFSDTGELLGGKIITYLLEKVRLASQQQGERNFHIFYQMCKGVTDEAEYSKFFLGPIESWSYCNQGGIFDLREIDDQDEFNKMRAAMVTLNFTAEEADDILSISAALLQLGQVTMGSKDTDEGEGSEVTAESMPNAEAFCTLCAVDHDNLVTAITTKTMVTRFETITKMLRPQQAADARDALCKILYSRMFDWIVMKINENLVCDEKLVEASISVLDIFGFECFKRNSFEQLCINFTNEKLQQQFNSFVFKMEQAEYEREGIQWSFNDFPDNQDCLTLIESRKPEGILSMLDDECNNPSGTDKNFAARLYKGFEGQTERFVVTKRMKPACEFGVNHYAGQVVYQTDSFREKNKDELPKEADTLFQGSSKTTIQVLFSDAMAKLHEESESPTKTAGGAKKKKPKTVASQFKTQLNELMEKIASTQPHYIRCLKPNDQNIPGGFNERRVAQQLRYGGVLEAVRVARSGFPVRMPHTEFYARYRPLCMSHASAAKTLALSIVELSASKAVDATKRFTEILSEIAPVKPDEHFEPASLQLGKTKVFLRKAAYDALEARRSRTRSEGCRAVQAMVRRYQAQRRYKYTLAMIHMLQRAARGFAGRRMARSVRRLSAIMKIQRSSRRFLCYIRYTRFRYAVVALQSHRRGAKGRAAAMVLKQVHCSTRIQTFWRSRRLSRRFRGFRAAVLGLQCGVRCRQAKLVLKNLKIAQRDVGALKSTNENLKAEIELLRANAAKASAERNAKATGELAAEVEALKAKLAAAETELTDAKEAREAEATALAKEKSKNESLMQQVQSLESKATAAKAGRVAERKGSRGGAGVAENAVQQLVEFRERVKELEEENEMLRANGGGSGGSARELLTPPRPPGQKRGSRTRADLQHSASAAGAFGVVSGPTPTGTKSAKSAASSGDDNSRPGSRSMSPEPTKANADRAESPGSPAMVVKRPSTKDKRDSLVMRDTIVDSTFGSLENDVIAMNFEAKFDADDTESDTEEEDAGSESGDDSPALSELKPVAKGGGSSKNLKRDTMIERMNSSTRSGSFYKRHQTNVDTGRSLLIGGLSVHVWEMAQAPPAKDTQMTVRLMGGKEGAFLSRMELAAVKDLSGHQLELAFEVPEGQSGFSIIRRRKVRVPNMKLTEVYQVVPDLPKTGPMEEFCRGLEPVSNKTITIITNTRTNVLVFDDEDMRDYVVSCLRDLMVQEHHHISMGTYHGGAEERISLSGLSTTTQSIVTDNKEIADMVAKIKALERDNQSEQTKYEKLLSQFMEVNNDYNEKQHYNKQLLKEREQFKQQLNAKDQMFKDDTKQRFQLSQKMQKLLAENAQLKKHLGEKDLKLTTTQEQLDQIRSVIPSV